jgi:hypothetical protein
MLGSTLHEREKAQHLASILPLSRRAKPPKPAAKFPNFQTHGDDEERDPLPELTLAAVVISHYKIYPTPKQAHYRLITGPRAAAAAAAMACSAHLLSQSLYSSHCSSPAGPSNLGSQGRPPARASPAARPGSRARGCRGVVSLRVAASFEEGRRQVEVSAFLNPQL